MINKHLPRPKHLAMLVSKCVDTGKGLNLTHPCISPTPSLLSSIKSIYNVPSGQLNFSHKNARNPVVGWLQEIWKAPSKSLVQTGYKPRLVMMVSMSEFRPDNDDCLSDRSYTQKFCLHACIYNKNLNCIKQFYLLKAEEGHSVVSTIKCFRNRQ